MVEAQGMNEVLVTILENQAVRTEAALKGLGDDVFTAEPGGDVRAIAEIGRHLLSLRKMKLVMLESKLVEEMPDRELIGSAEDLWDRLAGAAALLREAIDLVHKGVASSEDVDKAFCMGIGLRDPVIGPFMRAHLAGDGIARFLEHYAESYRLRWESMECWTMLSASAVRSVMERMVSPLSLAAALILSSTSVMLRT